MKGKPMFRKYVLAFILCVLVVAASPVSAFAEDYTVDVNVDGRIVTINLTINDGSITAKAVDSDVTVNVTMNPPVKTDDATPYNEKAIALNPANLRSGPGTTYGVVGGVRKGQVLELSAKNADGTWYKTSSGDWIFANLVSIVPASNQPVQPVVIEPTPTKVYVMPTPTPEVQPTPTTWVITPSPTPAFVAPCDCSHNMYNCASFDTHNSAQACFNYCMSSGAGDVHELDRDNDSSACETLP